MSENAIAKYAPVTICGFEASIPPAFNDAPYLPQIGLCAAAGARECFSLIIPTRLKPFPCLVPNGVKTVAVRVEDRKTFVLRIEHVLGEQLHVGCVMELFESDPRRETQGLSLVNNCLLDFFKALLVCRCRLGEYLAADYRVHIYSHAVVMV